MQPTDYYSQRRLDIAPFAVDIRYRSGRERAYASIDCAAFTHLEWARVRSAIEAAWYARARGAADAVQRSLLAMGSCGFATREGARLDVRGRADGREWGLIVKSVAIADDDVLFSLAWDGTYACDLVASLMRAEGELGRLAKHYARATWAAAWHAAWDTDSDGEVTRRDEAVLGSLGSRPAACSTDSITDLVISIG
jgi:PAS domain-containing protein